ncbi:MAG: ATP-binding protein [Candidatus Magnetominusculus sp. LBB02]|nr:ATP-binding protein [Candidatus Magnetominusculus sp. LBB02]MCG6553131.1 ATP-binding protein [Candidatus Magnetominusculus sp. LBB02]MCG6553132.1 ATP-binding protein [Candidatus Magnetominusculus sp. LBB02]
MGRDNYRVLVVDDDNSIRLLLMRILEGEGYTVRTASNGREAMSLCESHKEPFIEDVISSGLPCSSYVTLQTGELVYVVNMPIHIHLGQPLALSIALHTYPALAAVRSARLHMIVLLIINAAMWGLAAAFLYYMKKVDTLQLTARSKERLTALGEMAAVLAHEIRTPLSAIKGFAQYIRQGQDDKTTEGLDVIINESRRLEGLTNDLLVYARVPELYIRPISIGGLIDEAIAIVKPDERIMIEKKLSLSEDTIYTDGEKLKQVLINIIANAADSQCGKITITAAQGKRMLNLQVTDTGVGMDARVLEQARKPFFTTKARGSGLGLPIVGNMLSAMGGSVSIESRMGQGTSVTVTLPISNGREAF